jgi:pyruvate-ferredoxin/flavodoxin oxidoreductase
MKKKYGIMDGNEAVASVAYRTNEVIAIYPITPASPMGEYSDQWAAEGKSNIWGSVPSVIELQSEGGAAGAVHGALQAGSLTTTFTASQGLLLMIPNMYKIAGELTPTVFHIAARSVAAQALSIFGDHSDVMAARQTGFAFLSSNSVQEAMDFALIAQAATLESRIPFINFFDGFRTSHEINKIELLSNRQLAAMIDNKYVHAHRYHALSPDHPVIRGTAQNPDVFFQARESVNPFYQATPDIVQRAMDKFKKLTGRRYQLFDYIGAEDAERVIISMGSGAGAIGETVARLVANGEKVGAIQVHLFRPFSVNHLLAALPESTSSIAVLDRTKEPGGVGEPLYLDVQSAIQEGIIDGHWNRASAPIVVGGRYGLSSKEFTPAMVKRTFDELKEQTPKNHFTLGINDDVSLSSLNVDTEYSAEPDDAFKAIFYGLGSDGTVSANKSTIKIIGQETEKYIQGYFVYDSKKAGSVTESHLRFGDEPINSTYLIDKANFIACHQFDFLENFDLLSKAAQGATFLLNSPYSAKEVWDYLPSTVQKHILEKNLRFFVADAYRIASEVGLGARINTIMQTCFFAISGVLPQDEAMLEIKKAIKKNYGRLGKKILAQNNAAVDKSLSGLSEVTIKKSTLSSFDLKPSVPEKAPQFVRDVLGQIISRQGDELPVSVFPVDGTYPAGTTKWEKRNLSDVVPAWDSATCIQCGKCVFVCPHAVIREKVFETSLLNDAPVAFKSTDARWKEFPEMAYTLQVSPEDCTGCTMCVEACPVEDKITGIKPIEMVDVEPIHKQEKVNWEYFLSLPEIDRSTIKLNTVKNSQLLQPLFEFSGACMGCGETPYLKLISQLYGDRSIIANATGCSSIFGGNLPTTPWAVNEEGRGPAWSNSLFEDNAEFGLGMRVSLDAQIDSARQLVRALREIIGDDLADELLAADQSSESGIMKQRERVGKLKILLSNRKSVKARSLANLADVLVQKSIWIVGGDGWAYDIGYGGLDHVLASGKNVNIFVMDTEVYSNTGGQSSKATPRGAIAKFAAKGKMTRKKNLGLMAMSYGNVYVANIAMGASDAQTMKAITEAEAYEGPSLIIAYSHCIAHGIDMKKGLTQQDLAVKSGIWPLYRFDPKRADAGKAPLILDSKAASVPLEDYMKGESRFRHLLKTDEEQALAHLADLNKNIEEQKKQLDLIASQ